MSWRRNHGFDKAAQPADPVDKSSNQQSYQVDKSPEKQDQPAEPVSVPTFDEWFEQKHGASFEQLHMQHGAFTSDSMKELSRHMRDYVSELVQNDL